jgi:3'(2'), 5'-bisphosphate nucleotidase
VAETLATGAGRLLLEIRATLEAGDGRDLGARADRAAHVFLVEELSRLRPGDAILSEEGQDDRRRLSGDRVWIIDPLDGTREFTEAGRTDWAVHVALWSCDHIVAAAVALPARGLILSTASQQPVGQDRPGTRRIAVSRTRPPAFARPLAAALSADLVPMGSAGAKTASVILGEVDAYLHAGGQYEWDSAAPVGVAAAAGLHASRLNGDRLRYNQVIPTIPDLLISRRELAGQILEVLRRGSRPW